MVINKKGVFQHSVASTPYLFPGDMVVENRTMGKNI